MMEVNGNLCKHCPYHFFGEGEMFASCHCTEPEGYAPCEYEDYFDDEYEEWD